LKYAGRDPLASCAGAWFPGTLYHVNARAPRADPPIGAALLVERCRRWCTPNWVDLRLWRSMQVPLW